MKRGLARANFWNIVTFGWCADLISLANKGALAADDAAYLAPDSDRADSLARSFDVAYAKLKVSFEQATTHRPLTCMIIAMLGLSSAG